jgi:hypothetical protein
MSLLQFEHNPTSGKIKFFLVSFDSSNIGGCALISFSNGALASATVDGFTYTANFRRKGERGEM